jgi:hypothetical protein
LNRYAAEDLDGRDDVHENFAVRNVPQRPDPLPSVEVMPHQGEDAETNGRQSKDVTSKVESHPSRHSGEAPSS